MNIKKALMLLTIVLGINVSALAAPILNNSIETAQAKKNPRGKAYVTKRQFRFRGVVKYHGKKWTYYTGSRFADGSRNHGGYDKNGYIIVSAPRSYKFGTKIKTPLGWGVVHDRGTAMTKYHFDVVI
ncbi:hypothetical protein PL11_001515 [Lentilactobacillus curieae]|uniref:Uncharacterized protein n=1 Tax=Lentilactobacillus curieae TaxID=1138822 RepID=A0A1S6QGE4_9LACO|nr:hypothetical protein [Lentilactobacillus curieae]AQW20684.1 hypothetical protein PL11_001515 [Lentilactobacillus curieae]